MNIDFEADWSDLADQIHAFNVDKGWWDNYPNKMDRFKTAQMLVITELAEACEGLRKDCMDDKLPDEKMYDVEIADAIIRLLDMAGAYGWNKEWVGYQLLQTSSSCISIENLLGLCSVVINNVEASIAIMLVHCGIPNSELRRLITKKMEYNNTRADHLKENREKVGGKKF